MEEVSNRHRKLLITGANGFTGRHACTYFSEAGYDVFAVIRNDSHEILGNDIAIVQCDLTDRFQVSKLIEKVKPHFLIHLAGQNQVQQSWGDPISSYEANIMSTAYLLDALRKEHVSCKSVIVGSALQFNLSDLSSLAHPYSFSKTVQVLLAQSYASLYGMNIVIAKPSNLIGPGLSNGVCSLFAQQIVKMEKEQGEKILKVNNLNVQRDFVDVRDAVRAYETLIIHGEKGRTYDISSGTAHSLKEVSEIYKSLSTVHFDVETERNFDERLKVCKPVKLMEIGWKPTIPFTESLKEILDYYREKHEA